MICVHNGVVFPVKVLFVTSSHGSGDGYGNSYLCLLTDPVVGTNQAERSGRPPGWCE